MPALARTACRLRFIAAIVGNDLIARIDADTATADEGRSIEFRPGTAEVVREIARVRIVKCSCGPLRPLTDGVIFASQSENSL